MKVRLDEHTTIDTYDEQTTWVCTYIRLMPSADAIWLPANAVIECRCFVDARSTCPRYTIQVFVAPTADDAVREVASYSWEGGG